MFGRKLSIFIDRIKTLVFKTPNLTSRSHFTFHEKRPESHSLMAADAIPDYVASETLSKADSSRRAVVFNILDLFQMDVS